MVKWRERERNIITCQFISSDAPQVLGEQNKLDQKQFSFLILCDNENTTSQIGNGIELVSLPLSLSLFSSLRSFCLWCVMCQGHRCIRADQSICRSLSSPIVKRIIRETSIAKEKRKK